VRELDTLIALCHDLGDAHPHAAGALAVARSGLLLDRDKAARRLVKRLEQLDPGQLRADARARRQTFFGKAPAWRTAFTDQLAARATKLGGAMVHASGVYMPNRLHRVRIHLKKLRYLAEIAAETGVWRPAHLRRDATRVQDVLGEMHDLQVLLEQLKASDIDPAVITTLRAEIAQRHERYLAQRARLEAIVDACHRFAERERHWRRRVMSGAAGALLVPAGIALLRTPLLTRRDAA
jgi:CHAD domain-containing protein